MNRRPLALRLAIYALLASLLVLVIADHASKPTTAALVFAHILVSALVGFICFHIWSGQGGAVFFYLVLEAIGVLFKVRDGAFPYSGEKLVAGSALEWFVLGLSVVTLAGLLHPSTWRWLSAMAKAREEFARGRRMAHILSGSRFR